MIHAWYIGVLNVKSLLEGLSNGLIFNTKNIAFHIREIIYLTKIIDLRNLLILKSRREANRFSELFDSDCVI